MRLAHSQTANSIAREIKRHEFGGTFPPKVFVHPALHNGKKGLLRIRFARGRGLNLFFRSPGPCDRASRRRGGTFMRGRILRAFIEQHTYIRSERSLNFDSFLWHKHVFAAIEMR